MKKKNKGHQYIYGSKNRISETMSTYTDFACIWCGLNSRFDRGEYCPKRKNRNFKPPTLKHILRIVKKNPIFYLGFG